MVHAGARRGAPVPPRPCRRRSTTSARWTAAPRGARRRPARAARRRAEPRLRRARRALRARRRAGSRRAASAVGDRVALLLGEPDRVPRARARGGAPRRDRGAAQHAPRAPGAARAARRLHAARRSATRTERGGARARAPARERAAPARAARGRRAPDAYEAALARSAPRRAVEPVSPDDPMILMYTSGTTGDAQGRAAPAPQDASTTRSTRSSSSSSCARDRVLVAAPALPLLRAARSSRCPRSTPALRSCSQRHFEPERVWQAVGEHGVTFFGGVPTHVPRAATRRSPRRRPAASTSRALRFLFTAGAADPGGADPGLRGARRWC